MTQRAGTKVTCANLTILTKSAVNGVKHKHVKFVTDVCSKSRCFFTGTASLFMYFI